MTSRKDLGDFGERVAKAQLEAKGYRILEMNFRIREGEVDIVAERDGVVAFVEVKTRNVDAMRLYREMGFTILGHIDMTLDLSGRTDREWKRGIAIHGEEYRY